MDRTLEGFVLTRQWRDRDGGIALTFWLVTEEGPLRAVVRGTEAVMFAERGWRASSDRRAELKLTTLSGRPVDALYFRSQRGLRGERERLGARGHLPLEADIRPAERYLMERFITDGCTVTGAITRRGSHLEVLDPVLKAASVRPSLRVASIDLETDGFDGPILSAALSSPERELVLMVGDGPPGGEVPLQLVPDERALLQALLALVADLDPDVLIGWNVVEFDLAVLERRCSANGLRLSLGRAGGRATVLPARRAGQVPIARVPGRAVMDGIATLKAATWRFERFGLDDVAHALLGRGKLVHGSDRLGEILRLYREDKSGLAAYNLEDCRLVREIFDRARLLDFAVARQRMTGLPIDRVGGSVASFDHLYLPRLHRAGFVAPSPGPGSGPASPGGCVLPSTPGLFDNVVVLDFKSLYPSIILTFRVDPLGLAVPGADPVEGFEGARFSRERSILPDLISGLWRERDAAKAAGDLPLSRAIKIVMNSFYGVLGTSACRFFDPRLASSITRRGHEILKRTRDALVDRGLPVLYGDTDSLFVHLGTGPSDCRATGRELARDLTAWWRERIREEHRLESFLDVEFETLYRRFYLPTRRGTDEGSAKRYAGLVDRDEGTDLAIKGLEAVRTDWTELARRVQRELLWKVLHGEPVRAHLAQARAQLLSGAVDGELVYAKRLRRDPSTFAGTPPAHIRAAQQLDRPVRTIRYVHTTAGPEPVERQTAPLDYEHYLTRQLAPACDGVLAVLGTTFERLTGDQLGLF